MGVRASDNCLFICTCCAGLPILAAIKAAIVLPFCLTAIVLSWTLTSIILIPHDFYYTYKNIWTTRVIGPNIKVLSLLLLPIANLLWPLFVLVAAVFFGICYPIGAMYTLTFNTDYHIFGGWIRVSTRTWQLIRDFWDFNYHSYFAYLEDLGVKERDPPFDINIFTIIVGVFVALITTAIEMVFFAIISITKLIPGIFRLYYDSWKFYLEEVDAVWKVVSLPLFLAWNIGLPAFSVLFALIAIITGGFYGLAAPCRALTAITPLSIVNFRWTMFFLTKDIRDFDRWSNKLIFSHDGTTCGYSCSFTDPRFLDQNTPAVQPERPRRASTDSSSGSAPPASTGGFTAEVSRLVGNISVGQVWDSFFEQCYVISRQLLTAGLLRREDFEDSDPFLFIGLPSLTIYRALQRSAMKEGHSDIILLADGTWIHEQNRPRGAVGDMFYRPAIDAKHLLVDAELTPDEMKWLSQQLVTVNDESRWIFQHKLSSSRTKTINQISAAIQGMGINVSRLPAFHRRFGDVITRVLASDDQVEIPLPTHNINNLQSEAHDYARGYNPGWVATFDSPNSSQASTPISTTMSSEPSSSGSSASSSGSTSASSSADDGGYAMTDIRAPTPASMV